MILLVVLVVASVEVRRRERSERDKVSRSHDVRNARRHRTNAPTRKSEHVRRRKSHVVKKRRHAIEVSKWEGSTVSKLIRHNVAIKRSGPHLASE